jgi:DNA-binding transcriptional MocR family regulator
MEPAAKKQKVAEAQDFIKGWPSVDLLTTGHLKESLKSSFTAFLENSGEYLNYGSKADGAYMLGHPIVRKELANFLSDFYGKPVDWQCLMITGGSSMGTDLSARIHTEYGDWCVCESPTYFLAHTMFKNRGLHLLDVPLESDGMDLVALEKHLKAKEHRVKLVYTVPINHNPSGVTMSKEKRKKLLALAKQYDFKIIADEAYQLLNFEDQGIVPLFYEDDPEDPRVLSVNTFSKLIGPGTKVGWIQAHPKLIKPIPNIGFIDSGNNPAIMSSALLVEFMKSGNLKKHIQFVSAELKKRKDVLVKELTAAGLQPNNPKGGYFVWVKAKDSKNPKIIGRVGKGMGLDATAHNDMMRLCFAWLTEPQIIEGVEYLKSIQ